MNKKILVGLAVMILMTFAMKANAAGWETNFDKASAEAKKSGLYMLLYFSGSDWCHWCQKIDAEFFSSDVFKKFAKNNLICVSVDFPRYKTLEKEIKVQNDTLAKKYDIQGYPKVVILTPEGEFVGKTGYSKIEAKEFVENLKKMIEEYKQNKLHEQSDKQSPSNKPQADPAL